MKKNDPVAAAWLWVMSAKVKSWFERFLHYTLYSVVSRICFISWFCFVSVVYLLVAAV